MLRHVMHDDDATKNIFNLGQKYYNFITRLLQNILYVSSLKSYNIGGN